ncbi:MAG: S46 family peptidase [Casimicrobiaceae bacterium]
MMSLRFLALVTALLLSSALLHAEEGMWLFTNPPVEKLKQQYGFDATDAWLQHLQKSAVRFNSGGSAAFVSADGLVITNHHVGFGAIQKLSTTEHNLVSNGFLAKSPADELKSVDSELNVLVSIQDVTARVNAALPAQASAADAFLARRRIIAEIEKESQDATGLRADVVTLYGGGVYHLYRYKRYTDVRLVFAPEQQVAFFGGDPDNFEFPRYDLDFSLFRVYENGQPIHPADFLKWSTTGAAEGELTFVAGNPGRTSRQLTMSELLFLRDNAYPASLAQLKRAEVLLGSWTARSAENTRRAKNLYFGIQNFRKVRDGQIAALYDPSFIAARGAAEAAFRARLAAQPGRFAEAIAAYDRIAAAQAIIANASTRMRLLEEHRGFEGDSFVLARDLLRAGDELPKPNGARLREYGQARLPSFELELFSTKPIYADLEQVRLADSLQLLAEQLGATDPLVIKVLAGKSPRERAAQLVNGTKVRDLAVRRNLYAGGKAAVDGANDPMIELARSIDTEARAARQIFDAQEEIKKQAQDAIAKARFALEGTANYPDATFTLRLTYGTVKGVDEAGTWIPPVTNLGGMFDVNAAHGNREPFDLPDRWLQAKARIDLRTPFNFTTTHDIIGGNSGSPMINRAGEFVGIIFDGNIYSLSLDFAYDDRMTRSISVAGAAIIESLRKVYAAPELADELVNGRRR